MSSATKQRKITLAAKLLLPVVTPTAAIFAGVFSVSSWQFWTFAVIGTVALIVDVTLEFLRNGKEKSEKEEFRQRVNDVLSPLSAHVVSIFFASRHDQRMEASGLIQAGLTAALSLIDGDQNRARATVFEVTDRTPGARVMKPRPNCTKGRGDAPRSIFKENEPEGKVVWRRADNGEGYLCEDLSRKKPEGWPADRERAYKCFVTVPITVRNEVLGLLTINTVTPNALDNLDLDTAHLIAAYIGLAMKLSE